MASERKLRDQMNEVVSKNLYLEAYSRRENIKFFSIPEEEILRKMNWHIETPEQMTYSVSMELLGDVVTLALAR